MGEWRTPTTVKLSEQERADLQRIHDALAPMHETLSQTIRWSLRMIHSLMFTPGSLAKLDAMLQGIQRSGMYDTPAQEQGAGRKPRRQAQRIAR
jgi:hypothetical protein